MDRRLKLAAVVAVQLLILAAIPARQVLARARGQSITLLTAPVDPFSPFGGYYMTLAYAIERDARDRATGAFSNGEIVYLVVEKGDPAWTLVSVEREVPKPLPGRAAIRARWHGPARFTISPAFWARLSVENAGRFYLPEEKARTLEKAMADEWKRVRELPLEEREAAQRTRMLVDIRVDEVGNVALMRLRFGGLSLEE